jgi:integrase
MSVADLPDVNAFALVPVNVGLLSLVPDTRAAYAGAFARLLTWSESASIEDIPEDWFLSLCMQFATSGYSMSHLESYRSSLAFFQRTLIKTHERRWTQDAGFQTEFRGLLAICKPPTVVGAIGLHNQRLSQLLSFVDERLPPAYGLGIRVAHPTLVRHSELLVLRPCDFAIAGNDAVVTVIGPKGHKTSDGGKPAVFLVKAPGLGPLAASLVKGRPPFDPLFPEWDQPLMNEVIRAAAAHFKWDRAMRWSFHSLRHGMAQDMNQENIPLSERMMRGRWSSAPQSNHYARPDVTMACSAAELRERLGDLQLG